MTMVVRIILSGFLLMQAAVSGGAFAESDTPDCALPSYDEAFGLCGILGHAERVTFPKGQEVVIPIRYGDIEPTSFEALLNGRDVSTYFHPQAGALESADLPFDPERGRNQLRIQALTGSSDNVQVVEREINFGDAAALPSTQTHRLSREEMARLDALMKKAEEERIPAHRRGQFMRQHGFP